MRFDASQQMRLSQQMKLAPRMIQSMEILQMPLLQLEERIAQELESNATLEAADPGDLGDPAGPGDALADAADALPGPADDALDQRPLRLDEADNADDFARLDSFEAANPEIAENEYAAPLDAPDRRDFDLGRAVHRFDGEPDAKSEAMANTAARSASLQDQLREQWGLSDADEHLRPLGDLIIAFIDDDGYLRTPLAGIIEKSPPSPPTQPAPTVADLERALQALQLLLDPPGVAARDVRECLLLQTDALRQEAAARRDGGAAEHWTLVRRLIDQHLDDLAQNRLPRIAEKTGLTIGQVKEAMERMKLLSLAPARALVDDQPAAIIPDAIIEYDADHDRYIAYLNDSRTPNLRLNREYALLAKSREATPRTKEFLKKSLANAAWLIDAVEQRKRTLLRVINAVLAAQRDYFDYGPQALKPLPMTLVAEQLGVHVATVSRAVAEKHLLTPRGVVPLRGFFSGGTQTAAGEDVSWDAVKAALKDVIDAEDKHNPLSDDALALALKERGIEIARRTVAKYRDQLGLPTARLRKAY